MSGGPHGRVGMWVCEGVGTYVTKCVFVCSLYFLKGHFQYHNKIYSVVLILSHTTRTHARTDVRLDAKRFFPSRIAECPINFFSGGGVGPLRLRCCELTMLS